MLGKLSWQLISHHSFPLPLLRSRFLSASGSLKASPFTSSIWSSIKSSFLQMCDSIRWFIGSNSSLKFWIDEWIQPSLVFRLNIPLIQQVKLDAPILDFLSNGVWHLHGDFLHKSRMKLIKFSL